MTEREKIIKGIECCLPAGIVKSGDACNQCPYGSLDKRHSDGYCIRKIMEDALELLKEPEPRVMTLEEVEAMPYGHVLIETDKKGSLRWVDALLFCKNTNYSFDFITLEGRARLLGTEYNREWRCWTARPTKEQTEAVKWDAAD